MMLKEMKKDQLLLKAMQLQMENEALTAENIKLSERILYVITQVMPIVQEIIEVKGLFKIFAIVKLAIKLVDTIIKEFGEDRR